MSGLQLCHTIFPFSDEILNRALWDLQSLKQCFVIWSKILPLHHTLLFFLTSGLVTSLWTQVFALGFIIRLQMQIHTPIFRFEFEKKNENVENHLHFSTSQKCIALCWSITSKPKSIHWRLQIEYDKMWTGSSGMNTFKKKGLLNHQLHLLRDVEVRLFNVLFFLLWLYQAISLAMCN